MTGEEKHATATVTATDAVPIAAGAVRGILAPLPPETVLAKIYLPLALELTNTNPLVHVSHQLSYPTPSNRCSLQN
jgi:hypothetical protein